MKKTVIMFSTIAALLIIYSFGVSRMSNETKPSEKTPYDFGEYYDIDEDINFAYEVNPRFANYISKEQVNQANSVFDIIPKENHDEYKSFEAIDLTIYQEKRINWKHFYSEGEKLNKKQQEVLKSFDYTSSFSLTGSVWRQNKTGKVVKDTMIYYMTVVPQISAYYKEGKEALITYLKTYSRDVVENSTCGSFDPGKVSFVVSKEGTIDQIKLTQSCGVVQVDKRMVKLIEHLPGEWEPGKNANGEKVDQELVFFFGSIGC